LFYAQTQNKLLFATTTKTAAELIVERAKADFPNMGLTTWKGSRVRKEDVIIAKNYLTHDEIDTLNRLVTLFLDTAELRIKDQNELSLQFWKDEVDGIIAFSRKKVLIGSGSVSNEQMKKVTSTQYVLFENQRKKSEAKQADDQDQKAIDELIQKIKKKP
jgi:hypothetical protein